MSEECKRYEHIECDVTAAEKAMADIMLILDQFFEGERPGGAVLPEICQIAGRYKMEAGV